MAWYEVYLGHEDDPCFYWGTGFDGCLPFRKSPFFPDSYTLFWLILKRIGNGELSGKQVDNFGGYAARVTKSQILNLMNEHFNGAWHERHEEFCPHYIEELKQLQEYVWGLDPEKHYILAAAEL
jgi:hypothetical protein